MDYDSCAGEESAITYLLAVERRDKSCDETAKKVFEL